MHLIWTILIGFVAGIVARMLAPGTGPSGFFLTAALGIAGSLIATFLGEFVGWYRKASRRAAVRRHSRRDRLARYLPFLPQESILDFRRSRLTAKETAMAFNFGGLLQQYLGAGTAQPITGAREHFRQVAQSAPPDIIPLHGLAEAFRSDQTPPFGQMVSQLFAQGTPEQKAGMVQQLLGSLNPAALAALGGTGALGSLLSAGTSAAPAAISPQQASQLTPDQVEQIAAHAEKQNPSVIDTMSNFYAQHSGLVKTLGSAALTIALAKIANRMQICGSVGELFATTA